MDNKTFSNILKYSVSGIVFVAIVLNIIFLFKNYTLYSVVTNIVLIVTFEFTVCAIVDIVLLYKDINLKFNVQVLIIKIIGAIIVGVLMFVFKNYNLNVLGYILGPIWIIFITAQEKVVEHRYKNIIDNNSNNKK